MLKKIDMFYSRFLAMWFAQRDVLLEENVEMFKYSSIQKSFVEKKNTKIIIKNICHYEIMYYAPVILRFSCELYCLDY